MSPQQKLNPGDPQWTVYSSCSVMSMIFAKNFFQSGASNLASGQKHRQRARSLTISEIMTILIAFHQSHYRDFKAYYNEHVLKNWHAEFPGLVSYTRFVEYISFSTGAIDGLSTDLLSGAVAVEFLSLTQPRWMCASINGFTPTRSLQGWQRGEKPRPAGFLASNCTWWSMIRANSWRFASHPAMWMIENRSPVWPRTCLANFLGTKATFRNLWLIPSSDVRHTTDY